MIIQQSNGQNTYGPSGQASAIPEEKTPHAATAEKNAQSNGFITDRTELSAQALALSRSVPGATSPEEEQGQTKGQPPGQYNAGSGKSSSSINIHV
jgi:hypothetical protein